MAARSSRAGMLYILRAVGTDYVKIGFTSLSVEKRIRDLQTGCPYELVLVAKKAGTKDVERAILADLHGYRIRGEWFDINGLPVGVLVDGAEREYQGGN